MAAAAQPINTRFGTATVGSSSGQLLIHTVANWMWVPMIAHPSGFSRGL